MPLLVSLLSEFVAVCSSSQYCVYYLQVTNGAGTVSSEVHTLTLPTSTPLGLGLPTVVEALSPFSIYVEWVQPANPGGQIDQYLVSIVVISSVILRSSEICLFCRNSL